ncbi:MAG: transcriptional repressor [Dehalococcoidales bacterium]|nr:transcriptional repressor [Dehalococcoidales bacterium]
MARMKSIRKYSGQLSVRPMTSQRSLLLELIRQAEGHLDADELHRRAKEKEPRLSLATVYRNLKLFKELGLIAESNLGETHSHYEIKGTAEHHHLVCLSCGQVIEFDSSLIAKAVARMQREKGFDITSVQLKLEGYCRKCKEKRE